MLAYCLKCNKIVVDSKVVKTKNGKQMLLSKCVVCGSKKSRFVKARSKRIVSSLGLKRPLNNIPLLGEILF